MLADCELAINMLEDESHPARWRVIWVATVALLRTIGHVLKNVDCHNPQDQKACNDLFLSWKSSDQNRIFRDFISNERNFVRKEYEFGFDVRNAIPVMITEGPSSGTNFSLAHV